MFPIRNDEMMQKFLKNDDEYEKRTEQLPNILLNEVADTKTKFASAVMTAVFDPQYIMNHRWETTG